MAEGARRYRDARAIKVKLTGELELDIARVARGPRGAARCLARRRCEPGLSRRTSSTRWSRRWSSSGSRCSSSRCAAAAKPISMAIECADPDRRRRERARASTTCRAWSAASTSSTSSSTSAAASPKALLMAERGAPARPRRHGRQHGRHQPGDGAGVRARPALRRRRSRRADLPRRGPHARRASIDDGMHLVRRRRLGIAGAAPHDARRSAIELVRPAARPDDPVPHQDVGDNSPTTACARCWSIT